MNRMSPTREPKRFHSIRRPTETTISGAQNGSALTGLEARVQLVDDVDAALATNQTVFAVTGLQGLERILDLHFS